MRILLTVTLLLLTASLLQAIAARESQRKEKLQKFEQVLTEKIPQLAIIKKAFDARDRVAFMTVVDAFIDEEKTFDEAWVGLEAATPALHAALAPLLNTIKTRIGNLAHPDAKALVSEALDGMKKVLKQWKNVDSGFLARRNTALGLADQMLDEYWALASEARAELLTEFSEVVGAVQAAGLTQVDLIVCNCQCRGRH